MRADAVDRDDASIRQSVSERASSGASARARSGVVLYQCCCNSARNVGGSLVEDFESDIIVRRGPHLDSISHSALQ